MYNAFTELALRNVARNRGLSTVGGRATLVQRLELDDVGLHAENHLIRDGGYVFSRATGAVMYHEMTIEALQEVARNQQLSHTDRTQEELVQMLELNDIALGGNAAPDHAQEVQGSNIPMSTISYRISNVWSSRCGTLENRGNKSGSLRRRRNGVTYTPFGNE
jgi:hypothetical protein